MAERETKTDRQRNRKTDRERKRKKDRAGEVLRRNSAKHHQSLPCSRENRAGFLGNTFLIFYSEYQVRHFPSPPKNPGRRKEETENKKKSTQK